MRSSFRRNKLSNSDSSRRRRIILASWMSWRQSWGKLILTTHSITISITWIPPLRSPWRLNCSSAIKFTSSRNWLGSIRWILFRPLGLLLTRSLTDLRPTYLRMLSLSVALLRFRDSRKDSKEISGGSLQYKLTLMLKSEKEDLKVLIWLCKI